MIVDQNFLGTDANLAKIIGTLKSIANFCNRPELIAKLTVALSQMEAKAGKSSERWIQLKEVVMKCEFTTKDSVYPNQTVWALVQRELTLGLLYPKIDSHVSAQVNHLLKCPFNVHHDTGLLSLPLLDVRNFHIDQTPNVIQVLENPAILEPYLKAFDHFCSELIKRPSN